MIPTFLFYITISEGFNAQLGDRRSNVWGWWTRYELTSIMLLLMRSSPGLPPIERTKSIIARFLDSKTAQIDALIAKKEALLTKLAEKRTALISHAVTKGLDPSVPLKDSGVNG